MPKNPQLSNDFIEITLHQYRQPWGEMMLLKSEPEIAGVLRNLCKQLTDTQKHLAESTESMQVFYQDRIDSLQHEIREWEIYRQSLDEKQKDSRLWDFKVWIPTWKTYLKLQDQCKIKDQQGRPTSLIDNNKLMETVFSLPEIIEGFSQQAIDEIPIAIITQIWVRFQAEIAPSADQLPQ